LLRNPVQPSRPTLILVDDRTASDHAEKLAALRNQGYFLLEVDYRDLLRELPKIRAIVEQNGIEFLLFSRNDQVFERTSIGPVIRALKLGYSSFSGLDDNECSIQTGICLQDLLSAENVLKVRPNPVLSKPASQSKRSVSFIFDLEQLGCARFGLARILDVLAKYNAPATFFTTNFVSSIYSNLIPILVNGGHEIGLHGEFHEYLAGRPPNIQIAMIERMKAGFAPITAVAGANFIGRMDSHSPAALAATGIRYFVHFLEHRYTPFRYLELPLEPVPYWTASGTVWIVPISVETNNRPWFTVRNTIDASLASGEKNGYPHVKILMHPFRDGALRHLGDLEKTVRYAVQELGCQPVSLAASMATLPSYTPNAFVYLPLQSADSIACTNDGGRRSWANEQLYCARIFSLFRALEFSGLQPALCASMPAVHPLLWVHPHNPNLANSRNVQVDPMGLSAEQLAHKYFEGTDLHSHSVLGFVPGGRMHDLATTLRCSRPRALRDFTGIIPETALRLAYRASNGRHLF
jgi:peptidoglycan/xylan/chitin deacetylase (PgdA/CDA1 family)